ncbi:MAG: DUF485 domain-containing protein [Streptosporangiaceae bacterium]
MAGQSGHRPADGDFNAISHDRRFRLVRKRSRRLAMGLISSFLGWYFLYIALSAFARDLMAHPVIGHINVALLLGVLQFLSTFLLAWRYTRYSRRMIDPLTAQLRTEADIRAATNEAVIAERRRLEDWTPPGDHRQARHRMGGTR